MEINTTNNMNTIGNASLFAIDYTFYDDTRDTELSMIINDENILSYKKGTNVFTTRWNLDELVTWIEQFINTLDEDPYPVDVPGEYAAEKDINARNYDSDDEEFDAYYDKLDAWNQRHRWHTASSGAILADLYFQLVRDNVEISWNNEDPEENIEFTHVHGGAKIPLTTFTDIITTFLQDYNSHWS